MSIAEATAALKRSGVELWLEGGQLRFRAPRGALLPEQRAWLSENREAVIAHLRAAGAHPVGDELDATRALLDRLSARDVRVSLEDGKLKLNAPKGALDETLRAELVASRDALIAYLARHAATDDGEAPRSIPRSGVLPLSAAQRRMWFASQLNPGGVEYNVGSGLLLTGPLHSEHLRRAIGLLLARHESLRTTIGERDGEPDMRIAAPSAEAAPLPLKSVGSLAEAEAYTERLLRRPFDLATGPLIRFDLISVAAETHVLVLCAHHVVADGWSLSVIVRDLFELYGGLVENRAPRLPSIGLQAVDYAAWESRQTPRWQPQVDTWRSQLAGAPAVLELPTDRPRPALPTLAGRRLSFDLEAELVKGLRACAQRHGATMFMTLMAAWQVLMHRMSGQDDILVATPVANREQGFEAAVGCFINTVVIRLRFDGSPTFADILAQTRAATASAMDNAQVPFDLLVGALNPDRTGGHAPIAQVLFASLNFPAKIELPAGLVAEPLSLDLQVSRMDLAVDYGEFPTGPKAGLYRVSYEFATDLFDEATIARLHEHFCTLLEAAAADPARPVAALPLIGPDQERALAEAVNATDAPHDRSLCAHDLVATAAAAFPDRIAVVAGPEQLTYRDLANQSDRLARRLAALGVTRGSRVALCLDRTADMPMAALAVWKAGGAYVPLDPSHPVDRLRMIIEDAGAVCVVTLDRHAALFGDTPAILLDREASRTDPLAAAPLPAVSSPADLAYLIYTSGSTGRPKGVEVEHCNLVAFLDAMRREPGLGIGDVVLAVTTLSFDIAGLELWLPLSCGARVVIASRQDALDGARLASLMEDHTVTLLQATPATWRLLLEAGWRGKSDLVALCGGEAMPRTLAQALLPRVRALWNMYGPTETTIWSTAGRVTDASGPIGIGKPIANTRVYVLDTAGRVAPVGVAGELVIAGEGVTRGYHDRADLTERAFGEVVVAGRRERIYRTGDLARMRADGTLDYLGRRDQQVKVRGYRIELGEIEAALASQPGVSGAVAAVKSLAAGDERLVGYVTLEPGGPFEPDALRASLKTRLPDYMVPAHILRISALPLTPNGKVDRTALPLPSAELVQITPRSATPMTDTQRRLAALWAALLQTDAVGLSDNFFDRGGHSMLLVKLQAAIRKEFGQELTLVELFQHTTVAAQAERLAGPSRTSDIVARVRARAQRQIHG